MNKKVAPVTIELVFDNDCPNVPQARDVLQRALLTVGLPAEWQEWDCASDTCPDYARAYGSPTILLNRQDVSASAQNDCACCRIYPENTEFKGCPSVEQVIRGLQGFMHC